MQPSERYDIIIQKLTMQEMVTIPELMSTFDVSIETVRRDLNHLEKQQLIKKVYGGAILFNRTGNAQIGAIRMEANISEKAAIGRRCAALVNDGETVFLGPGTTVMHVARCLRNRKNLTVVTNSLYAVTELVQSDATIYFLGGRISNTDSSTCQIIDDRSWSHFCPPKTIIGASGISVQRGISDFDISDSMQLSDFVARSSTVIVAADNSKFGLVHPYITCSLSKVNYFITGSHQKDDILHDFSTYRQRFLFVDDYTVPTFSAPPQE